MEQCIFQQKRSKNKQILHSLMRRSSIPRRVMSLNGVETPLQNSTPETPQAPQQLAATRSRRVPTATINAFTPKTHRSPIHWSDSHLIIVCDRYRSAANCGRRRRARNRCTRAARRRRNAVNTVPVCKRVSIGRMGDAGNFSGCLGG
jgi:hypothetical protein